MNLPRQPGTRRQHRRSFLPRIGKNDPIRVIAYWHKVGKRSPLILKVELEGVKVSSRRIVQVLL